MKCNVDNVITALCLGMLFFIVYPIRTNFFEPVNNINKQNNKGFQEGHLQHCFSYTRFAICIQSCVL